MTTTLVRIEAPHFVAGYEVDEKSGKIVRAAPILRWSLGKYADQVGRSCWRKGWRVVVVR